MDFRKQHRVAGDTVITKSKQNILWKGNCLYFHSWKFHFGFSVQKFFTGQNANIINQSEITFQIFSKVTSYRKQDRVACDTVITESKQNIPWKGNCLYFHSWKFRFACSVQKLSTDQNAKSVNQSEITFQIFSNASGDRKQHHVAGGTVVTESKQNIPGKVIVYIFIPETFVLPSVYKNFLQAKMQKVSIEAKSHFKSSPTLWVIVNNIASLPTPVM